MVQRGSRRRSTADDEIFSATTTFTIWFRSPKFKLLRSSLLCCSLIACFCRRRCRRCYDAGLCNESGRHRDLFESGRPEVQHGEHYRAVELRTSGSDRLPLFRQAARVHFLRCAHGRAISHWLAGHAGEHVLECGQNSDRVQIVVVAQVCDAETICPSSRPDRWPRPRRTTPGIL